MFNFNSSYRKFTLWGFMFVQVITAKNDSRGDWVKGVTHPLLSLTVNSLSRTAIWVWTPETPTSSAGSKRWVSITLQTDWWLMENHSQSHAWSEFSCCFLTDRVSVSEDHLPWKRDINERPLETKAENDLDCRKHSLIKLNTVWMDLVFYIRKKR